MEVKILKKQQSINMDGKLCLVGNKMNKERIEQGTFKGAKYTDAEWDLIFSVPPTKKNADIIAKAIGRNPGAIELIWRYATTHKKDLMEKGTRAPFGLTCYEESRKRDWVA